MVFSCPFAYIDPMSGSILLQVLIAGTIGAVAFLRRSIWRVIRQFTGQRAATELQQERIESVSDTDLPESRAA